MKPWKPDAEFTELTPPKRRGKRSLDESGHWARVDSFALPKPAKRPAEISAALVGLAIVAAGCGALCFALYQVTGPRDTFVSGDGPVQ